MKKIIILLLLLTTLQSIGQIDSLELLLPKKQGIERVDVLNSLSFAYWTKSPHKGIEYGNEALALSIELNYKEGEGDAYKSLGVNELILHNLNTALNNYHQAIDIYDELGNTAKISTTANNIAIIYSLIGRYDESIKSYKKTIKRNEELNQEEQNAPIYANLGLVYVDKKDYKEALKQQLTAMKLYKQQSNILGVSQVQLNIAYLYFATEDYLLALKEAKRTLETKKQTTDKVGIVQICHLLTQIYFKLNQDQNAYEVILKARDIAEELSLIADLELSYTYSSLYFERKNDFKQSLRCYKYKNILNDSINTKKQKNSINNINIKFARAKSNKQIALLEKNNEIQGLMIKKQEDEMKILFIFGFASIILLLSLLYAYRLIRIRKLGLEQNNQLIHKQKKLLTKSMVKSKESNLQKDKFISIIAHDLRNPFNVILGLSEMLEEDFDSIDDDSKREYVKRIHESSEFTFNLLEDLLLWAKTSGDLVLNLEDVKINAFIERSIRPYKGNALVKNIFIRNTVNSDECFNIDRFTMSTIIGNLVSNAIKFTPSGGNITISHRIEELFDLIIVEDTGVGMSQEKINSLFMIDQNKSSIGTANEKGSGLGLILCYEFISKYGGDIKVTSELGKGTSFLIKIPM